MEKVYFLSGTMCNEDLWQFVFPKITNFIPEYIDITTATSFDEINTIINSKITNSAILVGFSLGGFSAMNFAIQYPEKIKKIALLVTSARETAWAIATHAAQRLAIQADSTWQDDDDRAGENGLKAARAMALLGYRTFDAYIQTQTDEAEKLDNFKAASYINYQGQKLQNRFYAQCYFSLTKTLDTHHMGRGRGEIGTALGKLKMPAFILSVESDLLIPPVEQHQLAKHLPNASFISLKSNYGHDAFLVEAETINKLLIEWL